MNNQNSNSIAIGPNSGKISQGISSIAIGSNSGENNQGNDCIAIGSNAALNYQSPNSISIGTTSGINILNNSIMIGYNTIHVESAENSFYTIPNLLNVTSGISLIYDTTTGGIEPQVSSKRFKNNIKKISSEYSSNLKYLTPVEFTYENNVKNIGLIAEEVEKYYPELVQYDDKNKPYSVSYSLLNVLILLEYKNIIDKLINKCL
jgi:hypothetical protein